MSATYPQRYAEALGLDLTADVEAAVLDLARHVAHASERRYAPLSTFLAGRYVAGRVATGVDAEVALDEAVAIAEKVLGTGPPEQA